MASTWPQHGITDRAIVLSYSKFCSKAVEIYLLVDNNDSVFTIFMPLQVTKLELSGREKDLNA